MSRVKEIAFRTERDGPYRTFIAEGYLDTADRPFTFYLGGRTGRTWKNAYSIDAGFSEKEERTISRAIWKEDNRDD
jgi:hypothetical protein